MEEQTVNHYQINGKYRIVIERAASTKGVDGFKVEANGDDIDAVKLDAERLYSSARMITALATISEPNITK
jgi:hypothetical protein